MCCQFPGTRGYSFDAGNYSSCYLLIVKTRFAQITLERVLPFWHNEIAPDIKAGKRVIIAAHGTLSARNLSL
jgi:bisphosphoglycerate-dependent phosphoglycerate mutase